MIKSNLTIVIPTYNEADIIESSLSTVKNALGPLRSETEVIIADDGSDDLPQIIARCGASFGFKEIRVMRNYVRLGKGESIKNAFGISQGAIVGFIDIDLSVSPAFIHDAVRKIRDGYDICIAKRVGNRFKTDKSLTTSVIASIFRFINAIFLFWPGKIYGDTQCGFKFFRREIAQRLYDDLVAKDGLTDLEILVKAIKNNCRISEIEVPRINDRIGKRKLSRIFIHETLSLLLIFFKYRLGIRFIGATRNLDSTI